MHIYICKECHLYKIYIYMHVYIWMLYELSYRTFIICMYVYKYFILLPYTVSLFNNEFYSLFRVLSSMIQISAATAQILYQSLHLILWSYTYFWTPSTAYSNHYIPYHTVSVLATNLICRAFLFSSSLKSINTTSGVYCTATIVLPLKTPPFNYKYPLTSPVGVLWGKLLLNPVLPFSVQKTAGAHPLLCQGLKSS